MVDFNRCIKCKYLTTHDTEYPCNVCKHRVETKDLYKPRTNADRIRSMSDEELAENVSCPYIATECIHLDDDIECEQCKLQWLKSEAKE